jgi:uncharacterized protein YidB (DUF937 family)
MTSLEDTIKSAVPGGDIGKPLMLALGALLASGALFKGAGAGSGTDSAAPPAAGQGTGGLLGGLGGLVDKLKSGGLGNIANSWVGSGPNQPVQPGQLGSALGPDIIKSLAQRAGLPEEELTRQLAQALPGVVDKLTPAGRLPTMAELSQAK